MLVALNSVAFSIALALACIRAVALVVIELTMHLQITAEDESLHFVGHAAQNSATW